MEVETLVDRRGGPPRQHRQSAFSSWPTQQFEKEGYMRHLESWAKATGSNEVPNLDAMTDEELQAFANQMELRHIFEWLYAPEYDNERERFLITTAKLCYYAKNAIEARRMRLQGHINAALTYEEVCQSTYEALPMWARW